MVKFINIKAADLAFACKLVSIDTAQAGDGEGRGQSR